MTVEIINAQILDQNTVTFTVADVSEERLQYIERTRQDDLPYEFEIIYSGSKQLYYLKKFLQDLNTKTTNKATTWGQAVRLPIGKILTLNNYRRFA